MKRFVISAFVFLVGCNPEPASIQVTSASAPAAASVPSEPSSHVWYPEPPRPRATPPYKYRGTSPYSDFDHRRNRF